MNQKVLEYISKTEHPYELKVGEMIVELEYSENSKSFNECILNILKQKRNNI